MDVIRGFFVILFDTLPCLTLTFNGIRDNISTATLETFTSLQERMLEMFYLNSTLHFGIPPVASIGIPVRSLLCGRQTSSCSDCSTKRNNSSMVFKFHDLIYRVFNKEGYKVNAYYMTKKLISGSIKRFILSQTY